MKTIKIISLLVTFLFAANIVFAQNRPHVPGELLVKFKDGTASEAARVTHSLTGASVLEEFPTIGWQRIKLPKGLNIERAITKYSRMDGVEYAQPNFYYHLLATPNDPSFTASGMYGLGKIAAPAAWDLSTGSSAVVVADIDTGLRYTHQDIAANAWANTGEIENNGVDDDGNGFIDDYRGWDFFFNDSNPFDDAGGHGTHTAGTIGAVGNNALNVVGVCWNVKIMPVKIYSPVGTDSTSAMLINAYNYITMMKNRGVNIRATNNSYGGCGEACGYDQATKDALDAMGDVGIVSAFAAGNASANNDTSPSYPVSYTSPSIIGVASSTSTDARSGFSSFGLNTVDLAAPGSGILSLGNNANNMSTSTLSGTSMATPHVTGAAALLSSLNPNLSAASLKASLLNNVDVLANWNGLVKTGGRLNVFKAMQNQTVCNFQFSPTTIEFSNAGGNGIQPVTAATNCDYAVKSNVPWITVTAGNPGSGNSQFSYSVAPMPIPLTAGFGRSGTISVGDKTLTITQPGVAPPPGRVIFDFDGDAKTDFSAIENASGQMAWHNFKSTNGYSATSFGLFANDIPVAGDFDGDGKTDVAVWRTTTGDYYYLHSSDSSFHAVHFGATGDDPRMAQDFDGDNKTDFVVTRKEGALLVWYVLRSSSGFASFQFGLQNDLPIRGDYDGDGRADLAVYRPAPSNTFFIQRSGNGAVTANTFGISTTDTPVPGDYDGDARTDIAVWRSTDGGWYYLRSLDGAFAGYNFGMAGDLPAPGDYDGDGKTDFTVWRPNQAPDQPGYFYIYSQLTGFQARGWGNAGMKIPANSVQTP